MGRSGVRPKELSCGTTRGEHQPSHMGHLVSFIYARSLRSHGIPLSVACRACVAPGLGSAVSGQSHYDIHDSGYELVPRIDHVAQAAIGHAREERRLGLANRARKTMLYGAALSARRLWRFLHPRVPSPGVVPSVDPRNAIADRGRLYCSMKMIDVANFVLQVPQPSLCLCPRTTRCRNDMQYNI